jgi:hypothetical protein
MMRIVFLEDAGISFFKKMCDKVEWISAICSSGKMWAQSFRDAFSNDTKDIFFKSLFIYLFPCRRVRPRWAARNLFLPLEESLLVSLGVIKS